MANEFPEMEKEFPEIAKKFSELAKNSQVRKCSHICRRFED